jgi:hypothetical protein
MNQLLRKPFEEYKKQMRKGVIQSAYQGIMKFFMSLRNELRKRHSKFEVSGIQWGYMDQTYFLFYPQSLKKRGLKVAIVFVHDAFRFDAWLASRNAAYRKKYWQLFKDRGYDQYRLVPSTNAVDPILEHTLVAEPDFSDQDALTAQIENRVMKFIEEVDEFLARR